MLAVKLEAKPTMKVKAWKYISTETGTIYRLQLEEVTYAMRKRVREAMEGWEESGRGWHRDSGNDMILFGREFPSEEAWLAWLGLFPLRVYETRYWGEKEKLITHNKNKPESF